MGMEFRLLGPLEARLDGRTVPIGGVKPRQLLATLLLQPGRAVSVDRLIDVLWPGEPPRSAAANVQTYVSGLRGMLGPDSLVRRPPGYACEFADATIDTEDFAKRADRAADLRQLGRHGEALAVMREALELWRGQPLADLPFSPLWRAELDRLGERRLAVIEESMLLRMHLGDPAGVVAELRGLTAEHPLRERLWALLIQALSELDRRADALATYAECRRVLADELGVEPGPELRRLHLDLLTEPSESAGLPVGFGLPVTRSTGPAPKLDAAAAAVLRGMAAFGEESVPSWVAGALLDVADGHDRAGDAVLDALVEARLVTAAGVDRLGQRRFRVPLLVRLLAAEIPADPGGAVRVLGGYLALAERAAQALPASRFGPGVTVASRWSVPVPPCAVDSDPADWFSVEHVALLTAIESASHLDRSDLAWELAFTLVPWCQLALRPDVWRTSHHVAQEACRRLGDSLGTAVIMRGLGQLHLYHDEYPEAEASFSRARLIFAQLGHPAGVAAALAGLGTVHRIRGAHGKAIDYYTRAQRSYMESKERWGEAYTLGALAQVFLAMGSLETACTYLRDALDIAIEISDHHRIAHLTHQLGVCSARQGRTTEAEAHFNSALEGFVAIADLHGEAYTLVELASLNGGDERLIRALDIYQRIGDRSAEAATVSRLSELYAGAGRRELAEAYRDEAHRLASLLHQS